MSSDVPCTQVPHALDAVQAVLARIEAGKAPALHEMQEVGKRLRKR